MSEEIPTTDPAPEVKYALRGMPFDRKELSEATRRIFKQRNRLLRPVLKAVVYGTVKAFSRNHPISWSKARELGYRTLMNKHFPTWA